MDCSKLFELIFCYPPLLLLLGMYSYFRNYCSDLRQVKEAQSKFRKASDEYESALGKHISAPKTKPTECEESANLMLLAKSKFTTSSLQYTDVVCSFTHK